MTNTNVPPGTTVTGTTVTNGNSLTVLAGGTAVDTIVDTGGYEIVSGTASDTTVNSGGVENVLSGGLASGTVVGDGGNENLEGGSVTGTIVESGGNENLNTGSATGTTVDNGGAENIYGGSATGLTLDSGASEELQGGTTSGTIVNSGADESIFAGTATGTVVNSGGTETVYTGGTATGTRLLAGGAIDRTDFTFASGASATLNASSDTLTVSEGGSTHTLTLTGSYTGESFQAASDGNGGTLLTIADSQACYGRGTLIRLARGDVAVEHLQSGDIAVTRRNGRDVHARVVWVGRRRVDIASHPRPRQVQPIRFAPGSLGAGLPSHPLLLSPDHALLLDGMLIAARQLVNDRSITVEFVPFVHYFHVELEQHGILLANNVEAESYLDAGNRSQFENAGALVTMHPNFSRAEHPGACAPLVTDAELVRPIWQRFVERALELGYAAAAPRLTTRDPDLRLLLPAGQVLRPARVMAGRRYVFMLHGQSAGITRARLCSRHCAAADLQPWQDDRRQLGVAVSGIETWTRSAHIQHGIEACALPLEGDAIGAGWWGIERNGSRGWRWTNGDAVLVLPPGCVCVEIEVMAMMQYQDAGSCDSPERVRSRRI